ncbi:MAG: PDZ domain-containing protein [Deltaproteobacteria bacterium]|nr:PDZ domain-containing protein [Deltaproteobacteria bacterium]
MRSWRIWTALLAAGLMIAPAAQAGSHKGEKSKRIHKRIFTGERGFLGVHLTALTPELRTHFGAQADEGVLVAKVEDGSPAARAGLRVGDVLVKLDGKPIRSGWELGRWIGDKAQGAEVKLELVRGQKKLERTATIERRERPFVDVSEMVHFGPGGEFNFDFDSEAFEEEVERQLESPQFKKHIRIFTGREQEMEEKLEKLEQRLRELERKLQGGRGERGSARAT